VLDELGETSGEEAIGNSIGGASPIVAQRPQRVSKPSTRLSDFKVYTDDAITSKGELVYYTLLVDAEPVGYVEALKEEVRKKAMLEELAAIERNNTWKLVRLPKGKKPISLKWVFKVKRKPDGTIAKHKARLVVRGFMQREGLDYTEVFTPIARIEIIRIVVVLAHSRGWNMWQLDVKSAFLNGLLKDEVYVT